MKILVTGASGYIGEALCRYLSGLDIPVTAIYNAHFPTTLDGLKGITLVQADITKPHSLAGPMSGCTHVFHTAAFCYNWSRDMSVFEKVNIKGTDNLLNMALEHGVKRFVFTSSAGTLGPATDGEAVREGSVRQRAFFNEYERTKYEAELRVLDYLKKGLDAVIVNPTRIFGPGLMGGGNFTTDLIRRYVNGTWHYLPGDGKSTGNYVYVD
ncbi:MAG: NAD-dependent epimerase/dehydratase family protein, partial [Flavobacteriales bacterium]